MESEEEGIPGERRRLIQSGRQSRSARERKWKGGDRSVVGVPNGISRERCQGMRQECSAGAGSCAKEFVLYPVRGTV